MDVARPDIARRKKRRRIFFLLLVTIVVSGVTVVLARLEPAAPTVDGSVVWTDEVKRGEMLRQVRGSGTLVPEQVQLVQAEAAGRVEAIHILPGAEVEADTVLLELSNPDLEQAIFDSQWAIKAAEAQRVQLEVRLEGERLNRKMALAKLKADFEYAALESEAYNKLEDDGLVAELEARRFRIKADDLGARYTNELAGIEMDKRSTQAQLAVKEADLMKMRAAHELKLQQFAGLQVRAEIRGVVQEIGDGKTLQIGQRVGAGATLAKIVLPDRLKAQIEISETQVKDVALGQKASIDTRNGVIPGTVVRVNPAVNNGTVTVDVRLDGELPPGARPDLSVDGTVEIERLEDVLYVGRPVRAVPESEGAIFRLAPGGEEASRVPVKWGRTSVSIIEVATGLQEGERVILSDMSDYEDYNKVRVE